MAAKTLKITDRFRTNKNLSWPTKALASILEEQLQLGSSGTNSVEDFIDTCQLSTEEFQTAILELSDQGLISVDLSTPFDPQGRLKLHCAVRVEFIAPEQLVLAPDRSGGQDEVIVEGIAYHGTVAPDADKFLLDITTRYVGEDDTEQPVRAQPFDTLEEAWAWFDAYVIGHAAVASVPELTLATASA